MAIAINQAKAVPKTKAAKMARTAATGRGKHAFRFRRPVSEGELIFFNSQLSLMMEIGMPLAAGLKAMADQTANSVFREIILAMIKDLEEGRQLSDAMSVYPEVFDPVYANMIRAGETGGFLKKTLDAIVVMQEKRQALVTQMRSTLTYPLVLSVMCLAVVIFVLVGILPKFAAVFQGKEAILPFNTRFLMSASASLRGWWWAYCSGAAALAGAAYYALRGPAGRSFIDRLLIGAPVLGRLFNKVYTCRLLRTLGHLTESSVPLVQALAVTQPTFRNRYYNQFVGELKEHVEQGERFSRFFATSPHILESVKQMVNTGEEVGDLTRVMLRLAEFYDTEVDRELKLLGAIISPIALLVLGSLVALIVSSVVLPMFRIAGAIQ